MLFLTFEIRELVVIGPGHGRKDLNAHQVGPGGSNTRQRLLAFRFGDDDDPLLPQQLIMSEYFNSRRPLVLFETRVELIARVPAVVLDHHEVHLLISPGMAGAGRAAPRARTRPSSSGRG